MRTPILLADGTIISVQASSTHYCSPRSDAAFAYGMVEIEVVKPNDPEYRHNEGWVNAERLLSMIIKHGGAIGGQLPPLNFGNEHIVEDALRKINVEQAKKEEEGDEGE